MAKMQAPNTIFSGWIIEGFRRTLSRTAASVEDVNDAWVKANVKKFADAVVALEKEETHIDEPRVDEVNMFVDGDHIELRIAGFDKDDNEVWAQHSFPRQEAVR